MKKLLIVNTIGLGLEGISSVIFNYTAAMNRTGLELHFTAFPGVPDSVREKAEHYGRVHVIPRKKDNVAAYFLALRKLVRQQKIDIVHIHGNSGMMSIEVLAVRLGGAKRVLAHCHSSSCNHPGLNRFTVPVVRLLSDVQIACSRKAGDWLFGQDRYVLLNNAIDLTCYRFDPSVREAVREELGIPKDAYVIGHIGRIYETKNQKFLVDIFRAFSEKHPDTCLLMVGDGEQLEEVRQKAADLGLQERVFLPGRRPDPQRMYQAMDIFVMPSRFEGLPMVSLEAQAAGLPVILSDRITREAGCTGKVLYESIDQAPEIWADHIGRFRSMAAPRADDGAEKLREHGFDIFMEADKLRGLYLKG